MNGAETSTPAEFEIVVTDAVALQAHLLLEQGRVVLGPQGSDAAIVFGRHGRYLVRAWARGVSCTCPAGRPMGALCSHALAAMVVWHERAEVRLEFEPAVGDQLDFDELAVAS